MSDTDFQQVDQEAHTVLLCIEQGDNNIHQITSVTTLPNHKVNYRFKRLEELGLITVENPGGWTDSITNGQRRVFQTPKQAHLTDKGQEYLDWATNNSERKEFRKIGEHELLERLYELEHRVEQIEIGLDTFRKQVSDHLSSS